MSIIDELDEQILQQLLEDGRKSFVEIGKACNASYEVIIKRYKEMKKKGIIIGATIQVDFRFFGYKHMASIAIDIGEGDPTEFIKFLYTIPNVADVMSAHRKYSITVIVRLSSVQELEEIKERIRKQSDIPGLALFSNLWLDIKNAPENLFLDTEQSNKKKSLNGTGIPPQEEIIFDDIDIMLIESLSKNARRPFSKIAQELGTSVDTIIRRYDRLKKKKALKPVIQIDLKKLGYQANVSFIVSVQSKGSIDNIMSSLSKMRNITLITKMMGEADIFLLGSVKEVNDYFVIRDQIAKLPFIKIIRSEINDVFAQFPGQSLHMSTF